MNLTQYFAIGVDASQALPATYDPTLVVASYLVATLAGYAFLRLTTRIAELGETRIRLMWMAGGGLTMGLGVWAMHFVAMLSYQLPIPVGYDPLITSASALPAVFGGAMALYLVARPTITMPRLLLGGTFMGAGIGIMHYVGMMAMKLDAVVRYDPILFATSVLVAVALAVVALLVPLRALQRGEAAATPTRNFIGALIMGLAVAGMHYTAMTSLLCFAQPGLNSGVLGVDPQVFAAATITVAALVLVMAIGSVIFDRRLALEMDARSIAAARALSVEQRLMDAIETMPDGLAVFDKDDKLIICNSRYREDYADVGDLLVPGTRFQEIVRRKIETLWPNESPAQRDVRVAERVQHHREFAVPLMSQLPDGRWILFRERRTADGGVVRIGTDISAVKQAEDMLRAREQHLALITDNVADAIVTIDTFGKITSFSRSAERIFGYAAPEVIGKNVTVIMADHMRTAHNIAFSRYLATGEPNRLGKGPAEVVGRHKNGSEIQIELVISKAQEGDKTVFIGALRDVSERKAIQAQLQQAQKMEAVGQLTGGIAHDFNNLLGIIIGNLDLLKEDVAINSEADSLARGALDAALRGAELNRRLLAFARRQSLQPERVDPNNVLSGMRALVERAVGERIMLRVRPTRDVWPIKVDMTQLEAAIINLAVNARDAMPDGGTLIVDTENTLVDEDYLPSHPGVKLGEYVCISVSDTGTGMTPDVQARAFEPFFTTKAIGKGSGLGLSMVFGFIKQSEGHVNIYSEPGHGTIVRLYLPRDVGRNERGADKADDPESEFQVYPTGTETVLVVEDNVAMGNIATKQLRDLGYHVIIADNALQALETLKKQDDIDLLFTDVIMPGPLDGIALTRKAIGLRPDLKVLLTSGFTQRASDTSAGEVSLPARLLSKPYRKHHLARSIRQALDE